VIVVPVGGDDDFHRAGRILADAFEIPERWLKALSRVKAGVDQEPFPRAKVDENAFSEAWTKEGEFCLVRGWWGEGRGCVQEGDGRATGRHGREVAGGIRRPMRCAQVWAARRSSSVRPGRRCTLMSDWRARGPPSRST
jgi:hypothetical protein